MDTQKKYALESGFALLELIIAIAIFSLATMTLYTAFAGMLRSTYGVAPRFTAVYLAKEGVEIIKNIRDNNFIDQVAWDEGLTDCTTGCQADYKAGTESEAAANQLQAYDDGTFLALDGDGFYSYDAGAATIFQRKITVEKETDDTMKVTVEVFWKYQDSSLTFETKDYLYNWH